MSNYWLEKAEKEESEMPTWDFETALGETIKEKYENLYVRVVEVSNLVHRKTIRGRAKWLMPGRKR